MKILLTGGNGFVGRHIAEALTSAGHELVIASRSSGIDLNHMLRAEDWLTHLHGVEAVINSVGIIAQTPGQRFSVLHTHAPMALFKACVMTGVKRVIQISALGADEGAFTPYQRSKKAADDYLRSLPLNEFVLRPSLVYGAGGKSTALFERMANLPLIPVVGQGMQYIQPVHIDDLVDAVVICFEPASTPCTLDIVGPKAMHFVDWLQCLRLKGGRKATKMFSVPFTLMLVLSYMGQFFVPLLHPDNLRMLEQGSVADAKPLCQWLGRMPHDVP